MWNTLSIVAGVLAALALLLGFIPLLGWTNWFLTLPLAILGLIFGAVGRSRPGQVLNLVLIALAALRLFLGGGVL
ncbi:hypothetical protein [Deinococcus budaensis]|uniref:Membrane-bound ClpP family serine protease n=1 Tax=Deinococcus budaensis TaxID=1665626 RepID=A0A7W8LQE1_9DEIO|nr:hypothetical protein [Deinococcus budaensis]MBB5234634.1 membrane-bound ClpP family serine protease [Deinococcus budaensis]